MTKARTFLRALSPGLALVATSAVGLVCLVGVVGCKGAAAAIPRCAIDSELGAGETTMDGPAMCPQGTGLSWIQIGSDTQDPITSGTKFNGDPVTVSCTVHPDGSNFDVTLSGVLAGQGSVSVINASISGDTTQVSMNVQATFESGDVGDFQESDCTWDFGGQSTDLDPSETAGSPLGIAAGRVWGNLNCPNAFDSEHNQTCLGQAELRFENCAQ